MIVLLALVGRSDRPQGAGPPRYQSREEAHQRQPAAHYTDSCKYAGLSLVCEMRKTPLFLLSLMLCWSTAFAAERGIKRVQLSSPDPVETPYLSGKYRALVIGNNNYDDPEKLWPSLSSLYS